MTAGGRYRAAYRTLVLMAAMVGGCSSVPPEPQSRQALLWEAATQCASGTASVRVDRIDSEERVHGTLLSGDQRDVSRFNACYRQRVGGLAIASRTSTPAWIADSSDAGAAGRVPSPGRAMSVTIQSAGNAVLVPVVLNGSEPAWFLLDTGANITVVTPALVQRLGIEVPRDRLRMKARVAGGQQVEVPVLAISSIAVGGARIENLPMAIYDVSKSVSTGGSVISIEGFLGYDFLGRFTMTLNPHEKTLTLQLDDLPTR